MATQWKFGDAVIGDPDTAGNEVDPRRPLRILVCGAFGGTPWKPRLIDRDNFDQVLRASGVQVAFGAAGAVAMPVNSIDDLHPDALYRSLPMFAELRATRRELLDPRQFAEAARRLQVAEQPAAAQPVVSAADLLADIVGVATQTDGLTTVLRELSRHHSIPPPDARLPELLAHVDALATDLLRACLADAEFQRVEATWRGLHWLVHELETDSRLRVYLLDCPPEALQVDLLHRDDPAASRLNALLSDPLAGDDEPNPWGLIVGLYEFGADTEALEVLSRFGQIARQAQVPLVAAAHPRLAGCESLAKTPDADEWQPDATLAAAWEALRGRPEARGIGLALPRLLLRAPYGKKTSAIDSFPFEEMPEPPQHTAYLWGNPALACALLLGQAFSREGWHLVGSVEHDLEGLPLHFARVDGETRLQPCAEIAPSERAVARLLDAGLIAFASVRDSDRVIVPRLQSIALPPAMLHGRWY